MIGGPYTVIVDRINLTGRYDFTIHRLELPRDLDGRPTPDPRLGARCVKLRSFSECKEGA